MEAQGRLQRLAGRRPPRQLIVLVGAPGTVRAVTVTASEIEFALDCLDGGARRVTPVVDGVSLIELIRVYETMHNFDVPGGYDGLIIDHFVYDATSGDYLGSLVP